jgi:hypothetical protein
MGTHDEREKHTEQTPQTPDDPASERRRREEADDRARHGQSLAMGDTGDRGTGVEKDAQGISNRPGDTDDAAGGTGAKPPGRNGNA